MNKVLYFLFVIMTFVFTKGQSPILSDSITPIVDTLNIQKNKTAQILVDGVVSVIGDYIILESDIEKSYLEIESQGLRKEDFTRCQLIEKLMEDKLFAHAAIQDSVTVSDSEIKNYVDRQIDFLISQMDNSIEKVLDFYHIKDEKTFRNDLFQINKINQLSQKMKAHIIENIEITPEEIRTFFDEIPEDERPIFGTELEISEIIIKPIIPEWEEQRIKERLLKIKEDVEEIGASFSSKALLYSKDPGSRSRGGFYSITKSSPMVKEFKDVAFSLEEGQISDPFKTEFGWHILKVDKIRGEELDVRHILLIPEPSSDAIEEARKKIQDLRKKVMNGTLTFGEAAKRFSDQIETKNDGGKLINPVTFDTRFELTKMDASLYNQVSDLKGNEISTPFLETSQSGRVFYKIIKVSDRFEEHQADFQKDYIKIKNLALKNKQIDYIQKWTRERINETFINIGDLYKNCSFKGNWVKK